MACCQMFREADAAGINRITPENLLVYSNTFQNRLLENVEDEIAQLVFRSCVLRVLSWRDCLEFLCPMARQVYLKPGQKLEMRICCVLAVQVRHGAIATR
jgi:hypothetical protein